jgi:hypothetical protein
MERFVAFARVGGNISLGCNVIFPDSPYVLPPIQEAGKLGDVEAIVNLQPHSRPENFCVALLYFIEFNEVDVDTLVTVCGEEYDFTPSHGIAAARSKKPQEVVDYVMSKIPNDWWYDPKYLRELLSTPEMGVYIQRQMANITELFKVKSIVENCHPTNLRIFFKMNILRDQDLWSHIINKRNEACAMLRNDNFDGCVKVIEMLRTFNTIIEEYQAKYN